MVINFFITLSQPLHLEIFLVELMMRRPVLTGHISERKPVLVGHINIRRLILVSHISKMRPVLISVSKRRPVLFTVSRRRPVLIVVSKMRPALNAISKKKTKEEDYAPVDPKVDLAKKHEVSTIVSVTDHVSSMEALDSRTRL